MPYIERKEENIQTTQKFTFIQTKKNISFARE